MNRVRIYVLVTMGIVVLASLSLWLVPGAMRQAFHTSEANAVPLSMTWEQAKAQVDSAVYALGEGMIRGDAELALSGCDSTAVEWLEAQRQRVKKVRARLKAHPARVLRSVGYRVIRHGKADEVATAIFGGVLAVYDSLAGEIVHAERYHARVRSGRFRLLPPIEDEESQIDFQLGLGSVYQYELGMLGKALEINRQILKDLPEENRKRRKSIYRKIADLCAEQGDLTCAYEAYEGALGLLEGNEYTGFKIDGKQINTKLEEELKYRLAQCALHMGRKEKVRKLCEELSRSRSEELVAAARALLADL